MATGGRRFLPGARCCCAAMVVSWPIP